MDLMPYLKSIFGLSIVIILIFISLILIRRFQSLYLFKNNQNRKIFIEDVLYIDSKNKVISIKSEHSKHLLLIGENNQLLIETNSN